MRITLRFLVVFLIASLGTSLPAPADQPPPAGSPTERVPNAEGMNTYPRWLGWVAVHPENSLDGPYWYTSEGVKALAVAVDANNVTHVVTSDSNTYPGEDPTGDIVHLAYRNDALQSRRVNGFSAPLLLASTYGANPSQHLLTPDIAIGPDGSVHVVWVWHNPAFSGRWEIYYGKKTATGWGAQVNLTPGDDSGVEYAQPRLAIAPDGTAHVVASRIDQNIVSQPTWNGDPWKVNAVSVVQFQVVNGVASMATVPGSLYDYNFVAQSVPGGNFESLNRPYPHPRIAIAPDGKLYVTWTTTYIEMQYQPTPQTWIPTWKAYNQACTSSGFFGSMGALAALGGTAQFQYPPGPWTMYPDVTIDSAGAAYYVWMRYFEAEGRIYCTTPGGGETIVRSSSNFPNNTTLFAPRVVTDSRDQVHVFWKESGTPTGNGLQSASMLKFPDPTVVNPTLRYQLPAVPTVGASGADLGLTEVVVSPTDQFHVAGSRFYTKSLDHGIGVQDPGVTVPAFPGAAVNVANGNLKFEIPLFSTTGVGPSMSFSLIHNTKDPLPGSIAPGWRLNQEIYLLNPLLATNNPSVVATDVLNDDLMVFFGDGRPVRFTYKSYEEGNASLCYYVAYDEFGFFGKIQKMVFSDFWLPEYKLTLKNGTFMWFDVTGRLRYVQDPAGNQLRLIYEIVDDAGNQTLRLTGIQDMMGNGGTGRVAAVEYELATTQLRYPRAIRIYDPAGNRYEFGYTGEKLTTLSFADAPNLPTYGFEYFSQSDLPNFELKNALKRVLPPRGQAAASKYGWSLKYLPDGRLKSVEDPSEVFLLDGQDETSTPVPQVAKMEFAYKELLPDANPRTSWVTDRRNSYTKYLVDAKRSLALEIHDKAAIAEDPGIGPVMRTFNERSLLTDSLDRYGNLTSLNYVDPSATMTPHVWDNLESLWKPGGAGQEKVSSFTYTTNDAFNNVETETVYATPADGTEAVGRTTTYTYNDKAQLISVLHPPVTRPNGSPQVGVTTTYAYAGARKQLTRITDEEGHTTDFLTFDPLTWLPKTILRQGGSQPKEIQYDALGAVSRVKEPTGGPDNDPSNWTIYFRDGMNRVESVTDPKGMTTSYGYDADSNLSSVLPPAGGATTMEYDKRGFHKSTTSPEGTSKSWVDASGNLRRTEDLRGFQSHSKVDFLGRLTQTMVPGASTVGIGSGGPEFHVTAMVYDLPSAEGLRSTVTELGSPAERVTTTTYDSRLRPWKVLAPDQMTNTRTYYDEQDRVVATQLNIVEDPQSCSVYFRDGRGRVDRVRTQDGAYGGSFLSTLNRYTLYDRTGAVLQEVDPLGDVTQPDFAHKTTYTLDARGRVQQVVDGVGDVAREFVYGDDDRVIEVRVPDPLTKSSLMVTSEKYAYTSRKELKTVRDRSGHGPTTLYGALPGQVLTVIDALNRQTLHEYDAMTQRLIKVTEAVGTPAESRREFVWQNGLHKQTKVWDPTPGVNAYTAVHTRHYDQAGRLERLEAPLVATEMYKFNDFGELWQHTVGTKVVTHQYNLLGQATQSTWSGSHVAQQVRTYNALGQVASIMDGNREILRTYDTWRGTLKDEVFKVGGATWKIQTHDFDLAGNYVGLLDGQNVQHAWPVDAANRHFENRYAGQVVSRTTFAPGGTPDRETFFNAGGSPIATTTHSFDGLGRRTRALTVKAGSAQVLDDQSWSFDEAHQIIGRSADHLGTSFDVGNDGRGQLLSESTPGNGSGTTAPPFTNAFGGSSTGNASTRAGDAEAHPNATQSVPARSASYTYGPGGNRMSATIDGIQRTYEYNVANQLVRETLVGTNETIDYGYDTQGNQSTRIRKLGGVTQSTETFGYNHLNLMSTYTNSLGSVNYQYSFWPSGDRYAKTNNATGQSDIFVARGGDVIAEYQQIGAGSVIHKESYVQGTGMDQKVARVSAAGERRHYVTNNVGTVTASLDDTGAIADSAVKDAWGTAVSGSIAERFGGLAQREVESESGLTYVRHRMYDSRTGRFTQQDPILGNRPTEHYAYASNNPISRIDPMGLQDSTSSKSYWVKKSLEVIGNPELKSMTFRKPGPPVTRNVFIDPGLGSGAPSSIAVYKRIQQAYAKMYLKNPDVYLWAGLAMHGSLTVGRGMEDISDLIDRGIIVENAPSAILQDFGANAFTFSASDFQLSLFAGGTAIFSDLYWQHMAFESEGIEGMQALYDRGDLTEGHLSAWRSIAKGRAKLGSLDRDTRKEALEHLYEGNLALLRIEQFEVVQKATYDALPELWWQAGQIEGFPKLGSPFPGAAPMSFHDHSPGKSFGNPSARWKYLGDYFFDRYARAMQGRLENNSMISGGLRNWSLKEAQRVASGGSGR